MDSSPQTRLKHTGINIVFPEASPSPRPGGERELGQCPDAPASVKVIKSGRCDESDLVLVISSIWSELLRTSTMTRTEGSV